MKLEGGGAGRGRGGRKGGEREGREGWVPVGVGGGGRSISLCFILTTRIARETGGGEGDR
jgi:hypothetical protein